MDFFFLLLDRGSPDLLPTIIGIRGCSFTATLATSRCLDASFVSPCRAPGEPARPPPRSRRAGTRQRRTRRRRSVGPRCNATCLQKLSNARLNMRVLRRNQFVVRPNWKGRIRAFAPVSGGVECAPNLARRGARERGERAAGRDWPRPSSVLRMGSAALSIIVSPMLTSPETTKCMVRSRQPPGV